jgi:hypothetical protein
MQHQEDIQFVRQDQKPSHPDSNPYTLTQLVLLLARARSFCHIAEKLLSEEDFKKNQEIPFLLRVCGELARHIFKGSK